jgi:hypothetical protein
LSIEVYDSIAPPVSPLLSASVLNDTAVEVTWQNNIAMDLGAYHLYRLDPATSTYQVIYTDNNPQHISVAPATIYNDRVNDTKTNTYTYALLTEDQCGYNIPLNQLVPHTTINITAVQAGTSIDVSWNAYGGCNVSGYRLVRTEVSNGSTQTLDTLSATTNSYLDTTLRCPFDYEYKVIALDLCGNAYNASSDTSVAQPLNILADQRVDVIRSTTINNLRYAIRRRQPDFYTCCIIGAHGNKFH